MDQQTFLDFRDLLVALEPWNQPRRRRTLVRAALWEHRLLSQVELDGAPMETASDLLQACRDFDEPTARGLVPLCALLAEIRDQGLAGGRLKARVEALAARLGCDSPTIDWPYDPYPGMLALDHGQAPIFFGRRAETLALLDKLDTDQGGRMLFVAGASGSGKSSLVLAGLWATLQDPSESRIAGSTDWVITAMKPSEPAHDPFEALMWSLAEAQVPGLGNKADEAARLCDDPSAFAELHARVLAGRPEHAEWMLILDQFEELFTGIDPELCKRFLDDRLLPALDQPRFRVVATVRSDFLDRCIAHPGLLAELNAGAQFGVGSPGPAAMTRMIEGPVDELSLKQPVKLDAALTDRLVADASGRAGGLALLAFALKDLYEKCRDKGRMDLNDYRSENEDIDVLAGIIAKRAKAAVARTRVETEAVLPRVFSRLLTVQPDGAPTRLWEDLDYWDGDPDALALIEALADQKTRLLVLSEKPASAAVPTDTDLTAHGRSVEVAHEALFTAWPDLKNWIDKRREALIRRPQVQRDAVLWDTEGRPDRRVYKPDILTETRGLLEDAKLWDDMAQDPRVAHFLARDDADELLALTLCAWQDEAAGRATNQRMALLHTLTAEGRKAATLLGLGRRVVAQGPDLAEWLCAGLNQVLGLLAGDGAEPWQRRRLALGDLMAALGDIRLGVGLRPDGLPDIAWQSVPPGPFPWQDGEERETEAYRIARYPVTNAQYRAFTKADDYSDPQWWREGHDGPEPAKLQWDQDNRPHVDVAWVEALAFCRWLTARYREQRLIDPEEEIRLPTEYEWEKAARGTDGRTFPWGEDYRSGDANIDETRDGTGPLSLRETTAVGLYPRNVSPYELVDCCGNVWEWCLNKYDDPDDTDTGGQDMRALRGGSWFDGQDSARASARNWNDVGNRNVVHGFRLVCSVPIAH